MSGIDDGGDMVVGRNYGEIDGGNCGRDAEGDLFGGTAGSYLTDGEVEESLEFQKSRRVAVVTAV